MTTPAPLTVTDICRATNCTRQHINRLCRKLFGPASSHRRTFTVEQIERLQREVNRPGRKIRGSNLEHFRDNSTTSG